VIYDISIEDDQLARQIASLDDIPEEQILDSQNHRQLPIEFSVLTLGFNDGDRIHQTLAPQPPMTLEPINILEATDLLEITKDFRFLHTIGQASALPTDDLMIAATKSALLARPEGDRRTYLLGAGRMLARILALDLQRLENILAELAHLESFLAVR
jgi:hypothetical protein